MDSTTTRIRAAELLEYLQASAAGKAAGAPERRVIVPTAGELIRTAMPALKLWLNPPKRRDRFDKVHRLC